MAKFKVRESTAALKQKDFELIKCGKCLEPKPCEFVFDDGQLLAFCCRSCYEAIQN